ncbi:MAG: RNA polymerase sigma factor [Limisphaerales bacterium]
MISDNELLRQYAKSRSEDTFAELVRRHVNLVYSAALRQMNGDAHLAQDVTQTVFTDLARKAAALARRESLAGWLYTSAHFAAAKIARTENRRRNREDKFMREPITETAPEADWEKIRPTLDDAMHELEEADRVAVLLRYFENRQFAEVGARFGLNENAARMRVERALEKLRAVFAKRGITTMTALASVISANAVQTVPAGLATTLTTASIAAAGTGTTFTLLKFMTATQLKLGISALVVAGAATALVVQHQTQTRLRDESALLRQQVAQMTMENQNLSNRLAAIGEAKSLTDEQFSELLKLRGEVTLLQGDASLVNDPFVQTALAWKAKEESLKRLFEERPDQRIPEMQFLTDWQWLNLAREADLDSEDGIDAALGGVRSEATLTFARVMQQALLKYMKANAGNSPNDPSQMKPFFDTPVDDAILQRYEVLNEEQRGVSWLQDAVIAEKPSAVISSGKWTGRPVAIGPKYIGTAPPLEKQLTFPKELVPVMESYQAGNNGEAPSDLSKLEPYVTTPEQEAAFRELINELKTRPTYKY